MDSILILLNLERAYSALIKVNEKRLSILYNCIYSIVSFTVARTVSECATSKPFDYILVTLKALPECYNVADIIAPAVNKDTTIVLIQNGLGVEDPIIERFPDNPIISIVAYIGTSQTEPGKIKMVGKEALVVGKYLGAKRDSEKQRAEFIELLKKGDVEVQIVEDVEKVRWQKLFW